MSHQDTTAIAPDVTPGTSNHVGYLPPAASSEHALAWFRPGLPLLAGTCGVVATAAILGYKPLYMGLLGLPAGVWIIGAVQAAAWAASRGEAWLERLVTSNSAPWDRPQADDAESQARAAVEPAPYSQERTAPHDSEIERLSMKYAARLDRANLNGAPLRIGVERSAATQCVVNATVPGELDVEWLDIEPGTPEAVTLRRWRLDALVRPLGESGVQVVTPEHPGREAAWFDWSSPRPLSYTAVFPVRLDCARLTIEHVDGTSEALQELAASLVRAAAAMSRVPARLSLTDRLHGRMPSTGFEAPSEANRRHAADYCIEDVALRLSRLDSSLGIRAAPVAAARLVSAWCATAVRASSALRLAAADAAGRIASREAEVALRVLATRAAVGTEPVDENALTEARDLVRERASELLNDQMAMVQAELETAGGDPLAMGRLLAGIALVAGASTPDRLALLREDFADDANHAAWLVGREQDRVMLLNAFRTMQGVATLRLTEPLASPEPAVAPEAAAELSEPAKTRRSPKRKSKAAATKRTSKRRAA